MIEYTSYQTLVFSRWSVNRGCGIARSPSGMFVNQAGSLSPTRSGPVEKVRQMFRRYTYRKPISAGEDMEETAGKNYPDMVA